MDALQAYASSSDEEEGARAAAAAPPPPPPPPLPPPPLAAAPPPPPAAEEGEDRHQGRLRTFAHVEGAPPAHVLVEVPPPPPPAAAALAALLAALAARVPELRPMAPPDAGRAAGAGAAPELLWAAGPFHLSLSRTAPARPHQAASLAAALRRGLRRAPPPPALALAARAEVFVNAERTRTFVAVSVSADGGAVVASSAAAAGPSAAAAAAAAADPLLRAIAAASDAFQRHGLPRYYDDPRPHVSVAWALGDRGAELRAALGGDASARGAAAALSRARWRAAPAAALLKLGRRAVEVWAPPAASDARGAPAAERHRLA
jgi:hypothetical protein